DPCQGRRQRRCSARRSRLREWWFQQAELVVLSMVIFLMYERFQSSSEGHPHAFLDGVVGGVMKKRLFSFVKKAVAPVALVAAMAAFSPMTAMAQNRGGHGGGRGFNGGHSYAAPNHGNSGRSFSEHRFNGGERREFHGDRGFHGDRRYYGG